MLFSSWIFVAAFLPVTWGVYVLVQRQAGREAALLWVTAASLFFYGWFRAEYVLIILISLLFNFAIGSRLSRNPRKALLAFGIGVDLAALFYYKYTGLFFQTLNMMGGAYDVPNIILPLGISFFTFQQITYLVDAWRGEARELNFKYYTLFVTFFPHMIAGPIVHHKEIIPQFVRRADGLMTMGLTVFIIGLFKKVAIADQMGEIADPIFTAAGIGNALTMAEAWLGAVAYTLQIYFDFSGYSDMAVGLAALFGVRMPVNFLSPYKAGNIVDFWRRWHITLSRLLREYLYIPLGGNRRGPWRRHINLMVTMLLGGLWHGANWTFVAWGALHGFYLVINHAWRKFSKWRMPYAAGVTLTFLAVLAGWVFFRAGSVAEAWHVLQCMAGKYGAFEEGSRLMRINEKWRILFVALALVFLAPNTHELMKKKLALDIAGNLDPVGGYKKLHWKPSMPWAVGVSLMAALALLLMSKVNAFIYFQF